MATVYVTEVGSQVGKDGERVVVRRRDGEKVRIPLREVERMVVFGPSQITSSAAMTLMQRGVPVALCSSHGRYRGSLVPANENHAELLVAQVDAHRNMELRLATARRIVAAKLQGARSLLRRQSRDHDRRDCATAAETIEQALKALPRRQTMEEMMGAEGAAAAAYFSALGQCFRREFRFTTRSRRPPKDPANALLSFGYTILLTEVCGSLTAEGLHTGIGLMHALSPGRPALALDVLELFRHPVVDRLALSLVNRRLLKPSHFAPVENDGVYLTDEGRRRYLRCLEKTMTQSFRPPGAKARTTYRDQIRHCAATLRRALLAGRAWEPPSMTR